MTITWLFLLPNQYVQGIFTYVTVNYVCRRRRSGAEVLAVRIWLWEHGISPVAQLTLSSVAQLTLS